MSLRYEASNLEFGLCCINQTLRFPLKDKSKKSKNQPPSREIFPNRTMISKNFTVDKAKQLALQNIEDMFDILRWNDQHDIKHYRMSSDIFPHFTNPLVESYSMDFAFPLLSKLGELVGQLGHRITAHPGQYVQIGAKDRDVFEKSVEDLQMHTDIMNAMNIPSADGILCIHGGGVYGDKEGTMRRWVDQFDDLPRDIQDRIAIEHCEKCYSLVDVMELSERTNIPVIFDNLHYDCYSRLHPNETIPDAIDLLPEVVEKWKDRGAIPVMHLSEQRKDSKIGKHSDYITKIPDVFFDVVKQTDTKIHLEVEAKMKELAILQLHAKYKKSD